METHAWALAFGAVAATYERGRPGYPAEAVARLGLGPGSTVVDVGAGTGKLTRALAARGAQVVAVEPLPEMRAFLERLDGVRALAGTAEALPLEDGVADLVTVGHAFHWFRAREALAEIHRVLAPGGALAMLWNRLDTGDPFTAAFAALLERHRAHPALDRDPFDVAPLFAPVELAAYPHGQSVDAGTLAARLASESSIAALPPRARERALAEARALGAGTLRYVTEVYSTRTA